MTSSAKIWAQNLQKQEISIQKEKSLERYTLYLKKDRLKKPLLTPFNNLLYFPSYALAEKGAQELTKDRPFTYLPFILTALDYIKPAQETYIEEFVNSLEIDFLCLKIPGPESLQKQWAEEILPLREKTEALLKYPLPLEENLLFCSVPSALKSSLRKEILSLDIFHLAALLVLRQISSSVLLSFLALKKKLSPEAFWRISHLEELYQEVQWGKEESAIARRETSRQEIQKIFSFLDLMI